MSTLAPDLFDRRRFSDLMAIGRARLPSLAPDWTDHNAHDPGITLMELLAWVAEAQLYSVTRMRRDERAAYAALLGLKPKGAEPARGVIWRDTADPGSPAATYAHSVAIPADAVIGVVGAETPTFRPTHKLLWAPSDVRKLETRHADGTIGDHTAINAHGGAPFLPFGEDAGPRDVLRLTFRNRDDAGLFGANRQEMKGARWAIGVRAATPRGGTSMAAIEPAPSAHSPLEARLIFTQRGFRVPIVSDTTQGFLATGAVLLDLDALLDRDDVAFAAPEVTVELSFPAGAARPPRVLRIEPSVIPVEQGRKIQGELQIATGLPDWSFELGVPGLRFGEGQPPVVVEVAERRGFDAWQACDRLADSGPGDTVYELDPVAGRVTFGNGINGRVPPADSQVLVSYWVSDGDKGAVARNRQWRVAGFGGAFGRNPDAVGGGAPAAGSTEQRREARRRSREEHALVTPDDVVGAARALPLLEVTRAWVPPPSDKAPRTGAITLVAMRSRHGGPEPARVPETRRWLDAIRRRLAPRMPLGTRLVVTAPRYVDFHVEATLVADAGRDPVKVAAEVTRALDHRLALVATPAGDPPRRPGVPLTRRDVIAWMLGVEGVKIVSAVRLVRAATGKDGDITVPSSGLPRLDVVRTVIDVRRSGAVS